MTQLIDERNRDQFRTFQTQLLNFREKIAERIEVLLGNASAPTPSNSKKLIDLNIAYADDMES